MQIDLNADEIGRLRRLLHLADDAKDTDLWRKLTSAHERALIHPSVIARNEDARCVQAKAGVVHPGHDFTRGIELHCPGVHQDAMGAPVLQPNPIQHCAEGLTNEESMAAYKQLKERFGLRSAQRSRLDHSPCYSAALRAAHEKRWADAERALARGGIIE